MTREYLRIEETEKKKSPSADSISTVAVTAKKETWAAKVDGCQTRADFLALFTELGIPGNKWKSSWWLQKISIRSKEEGGINKSLANLSFKIIARFGGSPKFVAWMEGKEKPDESWNKKVEACISPEDFLVMFNELGIPDDKWKDRKWLMEKARLPEAEGGIGKNLVELCRALKKKFVRFRKFVDWMEGGKNIKTTWVEKVEACRSPEDFLAMFVKLGVPGNKWKSDNWLERKAGLPKEQGGIDKKLSGLGSAIRRKFGSFGKFGAFMEGREEPRKTWGKTDLENCKTPHDFLALFEKIGIPGDIWKSSIWLQKKAKLPEKEGGIGKTLAGLDRAIKRRFGNHPKFVAFMEGSPVARITSPEEVTALIRQEAARLGITEEDLLDPEKLSANIRKSPALKEILKYCAAK